MIVSKPKTAIFIKIFVLVLTLVPEGFTFSSESSFLRNQGKYFTDSNNHLPSGEKIRLENGSSQTRLDLSPGPLASVSTSVARKATQLFPPLVQKTMLIGFGLLLLLQRQRILYPGSFPDSSHSEPLPPGEIGGCPWIGKLNLLTRIDRGVSKTAKSTGRKNPKFFKAFGYSSPILFIAGNSESKKILKNEFGGGIAQKVDYGLDGKFLEVLMGAESLIYEAEDGQKYNYLRKMVGQGLSTQKVNESIPTLQSLAQEFVDGMLAKKGETLVMRDEMQDQSINIACKQIIGLDFKTKEEYYKFEQEVVIWTSAVTKNVLYALPLPGFIFKLFRFYKAKKNIEKAVEERIQKIQIDGPDNSTLSGMVLAIDDEAEDDDSKHLTYQQIVDNVLFLIAAGSDTTSMTLTNTLFLLGFHTEVWDQVVAEQEKIIAEHGNNLSQDILERNCQYLDAVIKESMRLITISAGLFRTINETLVIDGYQIPKDWLAILSIYLTHEYDEKTWKEDLSHMDLFQGFKPERWLEVETRPKEFVPYGVGRRYCLGKALASTNMIVFLSVLVRNVKSLELLTDTKNLKWKDGLIDTPKDGVRMKLHPKN